MFAYEDSQKTAYMKYVCFIPLILTAKNTTTNEFK